MRLPSSAALGETVADVSRAEIFDGTVQPGDTLQENTLSQKLSVRFSPARESLHQPEQERLVEGRVNRPSIARRPSAEEIFQVYTIRASLEGLAARWAAERTTPEMISDLRARAEELRKTTSRSKDGASGELLRQAFDFHAAIATASGSPDLLYVLTNLRNQIRAVMAAGFAGLTEYRADHIYDEHMALISAIEAADGDVAERLASEHVQHARDRILLSRPYDGALVFSPGFVRYPA